MPGGKYDIVHITAVRNPVVDRITHGVGRDTSTKRLNGLLLMPFYPNTTVVFPRPYPDSANPFKLQFPHEGAAIEIAAHFDRFPPDVLCLEGGIFRNRISVSGGNEWDRFRQIYIFSLSVAKLLKTMDMPYPVVSCHGVETGLIPYILRADRAFDNTRILFTIHHSEVKEEGETRFDVDLGLFPKKLFEGKSGFKRLFEQGSGLFFNDMISLLKTGIFFSDVAMVLRQAALEKLFGPDMSPSNFFRRAHSARRLRAVPAILRENEVPASMTDREMPKLAVDALRELVFELEPYRYSVEASHLYLKTTPDPFLIRVGEDIPDYLGKISRALKKRGMLPAKIDAVLLPESLPSAAGNSIVHMLSETTKYGESSQVIQLNAGAERSSFVPEMGLRKAGVLLPQLPKKWDSRILILGNTTIYVYKSKLTAGSIPLEDSGAGIVIFASPIKSSKISEDEKKRISEGWGVIFANKRDGLAWSIKEKPSLEEIEQGVGLSGGDMFFISYSDYAVSGAVRGAILKELFTVQEGHIGQAFAEKHALHPVKHIFGPMIVDGVEWMRRWESEGFANDGQRIDRVEWEELWRIAQRIKDVSGGIVVASSPGVFVDLRGKTQDERIENENRLSRMLSSDGVDQRALVFKKFFGIKIPETPAPAEEAKTPPPEKPPEQSPRSILNDILEQNELDPSHPVVAQAAEEILRSGMKLGNGELTSAIRTIKFKKIMTDSLGSMEHPFVLKCREMVDGVLRTVESGGFGLVETEMREMARDLKLNIIVRSMEPKWVPFVKSMLLSLPAAEFDRMPVDRVIDLLKVIVNMGQKLRGAGFRGEGAGQKEADLSLDAKLEKLFGSVSGAFKGPDSPFLKNHRSMIDRLLKQTGEKIKGLSGSDIERIVRDLKSTVVRIAEEWDSPDIVTAVLGSMPTASLDMMTVDDIIETIRNIERLSRNIFNAREKMMAKPEEASFGSLRVIAEDQGAYNRVWGAIYNDAMITVSHPDPEGADSQGSLVVNVEPAGRSGAGRFWGFAWQGAFITIYHL